MTRNRATQFLLYTFVAIVVVVCVLAILDTSIGSIVFDASGHIVWASFVLAVATCVTFLSILLGDSTAYRALLLKTILFAVLVYLFVSGTGAAWMSATFGREIVDAPSIRNISAESSRLNEVVAILNIPQVMLFLFGLWFFRTALWPTLSK